MINLEFLNSVQNLARVLKETFEELEDSDINE